MMTSVTEMESPIGCLRLGSNGRALTRLAMLDDPAEPLDHDEHRSPDPVLDAARTQLAQYFTGARRAFELPLELDGTPFQRRVWEALRAIPYGTTLSYRELAIRIEQPTATRAVGLANGRNPIAVIVPCHRVIGADGSLTGYGGGLGRKRILLDHEATQCGRTTPTPSHRASARGTTPGLSLPGIV